MPLPGAKSRPPVVGPTRRRRRSSSASRTCRRTARRWATATSCSGTPSRASPGGRAFLQRFRAGGGTLLELECLTDETGRRVAAFGHWAGYAGAALSLRALAGQTGPVDVYGEAAAMTDEVGALLAGQVPRVLIIGAQGRVGRGAATFCAEVGAPVTARDTAETAHGGPFPEIMAHDVFLN